MQLTQVVSAIIRRGDEILMVRQPDDDQTLYWFIPGGVVEPGEMLGEALVREVKEETGLTLVEAGGLAFMTQIHAGHEARQTLAYVFEVSAYHGTLGPDDPDQLTHAVSFVPLAEAMQRLTQVQWAHMRDPLLAYLNGSSPQGRLWQYRQQASGVIDLI